MKLFALIVLTMIAFASNSILNRLAVGSGAIDASGFAVIRVLAGAVTLVLLARGRLRLFAPGRGVGAISLAIYMIGFSLAYRALDAGLGALTLFGAVQIGMFGWSAFKGNASTTRQMSGAAVAFCGLAIALWPAQDAAVGVVGSLFMVVAGLAWAAYTLNGRGSSDPLADTGANFVMCLPLMCFLFFGPAMHLNAFGVGLAVLCGAVTSGLGYALWYWVLPQIKAQTAAVLQLCVPLIAIAGGAVFLGESLSAKLAVSAVLVLGGIALSVTSGSAQAGRK